MFIPTRSFLFAFPPSRPTNGCSVSVLPHAQNPLAAGVHCIFSSATWGKKEYGQQNNTRNVPRCLQLKMVGTEPVSSHMFSCSFLAQSILA